MMVAKVSSPLHTKHSLNMFSIGEERQVLLPLPVSTSRQLILLISHYWAFTDTTHCLSHGWILHLYRAKVQNFYSWFLSTALPIRHGLDCVYPRGLLLLSSVAFHKAGMITFQDIFSSELFFLLLWRFIFLKMENTLQLTIYSDPPPTFGYGTCSAEDTLLDRHPLTTSRAVQWFGNSDLLSMSSSSEPPPPFHAPW